MLYNRSGIFSGCLAVLAFEKNVKCFLFCVGVWFGEAEVPGLSRFDTAAVRIYD